MISKKLEKIITIENEQNLSLSSGNNSEAETVPSISTTPSASSANSLVQKKRKPIYNTSAETSIKSRSNLKITDYSKVVPPCPPKRQELITQALVSFIIKFVQPLYILQNTSFRELLPTCEPGYRIPCNKTVKALIYDSFLWSKEQLCSLLSNSMYCTLSLVYPYVELLKKVFAPKHKKGESYDTYLNLIYGQQCEDGDEEESDSSVSDNDKIPSGAKDPKNEINLDEFSQIELLPAANTVGFFQKVRVAIFLSLDELWSAPSDLARITTILDPRFKDFKWDDTFEEREKSLELLQNPYDSIKEDPQPRDKCMQKQPTFYDYSDDDDFFKALENEVGSSESTA
ncbi:1362_t:CDS:2 [Dentiscutata erythropus]|uniref:1362_t:CDS:1 n=1 Tax=Dentiscutata erythropus TaxID=1348616 RepID=A0A9N9N2D9_9GLOM|nr:1362_t:CDS:2 [Dentiscutata erythropus]